VLKGLSHLRAIPWRYSIVSVAAAMLAAMDAHSACLSLIKGPVLMDVKACKKINPAEIFDLTKDKYKFIRDLDAQGRKEFLGLYRGLYVKGQVVKSQAIEKGMGNKGALEGDEIYGYVLPGKRTCELIMGKRIAANIDEKCCDGGGDPPCLLSTSYLLKSVKPIGKAGSAAGDRSRISAGQSENYKKAELAYRKKDYKKAAKYYETAKSYDELDVRGYYKLGLSYYKQDICSRAIYPLEEIHQRELKKKIFGDEQDTARKAKFLLARCYSKTNQPEKAVLLLQGYLLEPRKYRLEIRQSLKHKDFGWIHTSKAYRDYKRDALKAK
jgi:tetratricopeptide (TPR) repeat protein